MQPAVQYRQVCSRHGKHIAPTENESLGIKCTRGAGLGLESFSRVYFLAETIAGCQQAQKALPTEILEVPTGA